MPDGAGNAPGADFVRVGAKDNFYQSSAFIPMSFALVTTVHESGETGIGPHALLSPIGITDPYSMLLISRGNSATAANIQRTGQCALNYIEYDRKALDAITGFGVPGRPLAEKLKDSPYTLIESPDTGKRKNPDAPMLIAESCQVFECTWNRDIDLDTPLNSTGDEQARHFVLTIDNILLREKYEAGVEDGDLFPNMPIFFGFRARREFWFAEHGQPFPISLPKVEGMEGQSIYYLANRLDENVRFSREACEQLKGIPGPFIKTALKGIIAIARNKGIDTVDETALRAINAEREAN